MPKYKGLLVILITAVRTFVACKHVFLVLPEVTYAMMQVLYSSLPMVLDHYVGLSEYWHPICTNLAIIRAKQLDLVNEYYL